MSSWHILFFMFKILVFFGQKWFQHQILPTILFLPSLQSWSRAGSISRSSHIWDVISTCSANRWSSKDFQRLLSWLLLYKYNFIHLLVVAMWDPFIHHENLWSRGLYTTNTVDGIIEKDSSRHHLICKSVVLGSRHLGHRCTLRAFFQDELLTSITQLGWEQHDCWQTCGVCDISKCWNLHPYFDLEGDSQVLTCKCQTSLSSQA